MRIQLNLGSFILGYYDRDKSGSDLIFYRVCLFGLKRLIWHL